MVGDHHGEDNDDGDEDEDGEDDRSKVADDSSLTSCVHSSGGLHVCSEKRRYLCPIQGQKIPFKHPTFHVSKGESSMALKFQ